MSDQPATITLKMLLDQAALNQSRAGVQSIQKDIAAFKAETQTAGGVSDAAISNMVKSMSKLQEIINADKQAVDDLNASFAATSQTAEALGKSGGGGFGGVSGLRRTGSSLTGLGLDEIGQPVQKIGELGQVVKELGVVAEAAGLPTEALVVGIGGLELAISPVLVLLAPLVIAFGAAALSIKILSDQADAAKKAVDAEYDAIQRKIDQDDANRKKSRSTSSEANQLDTEDVIAKRADVLKALQKARDEKAKNDKDFADLGSSFAPDTRNALGAKGQELDKKITEFETELSGLNDSFTNNTQNLDPLIKAQEEHNKQLKDEKAAQDARNKEADKTIALAKTEAQLLATGTSKGIQAHIDEIKAEESAINSLLSKGGLSDDKISELKARLADLGTEESDLTNKILPLVEVLEKEKKATDDLKKTIDNTAKSLEAQDKATAKYKDDVAKIEETSNQDRANIEQAYADKRVEIAQKAVQQAQDALTKLEQQQADLGTSLGRDLEKSDRDAQAKQLQAQISFQREEVKDKRDHLQRLKDIQRSSYESDQQALLDGNYTQLSKNKLATNAAITTENEKFSQQEQDRIAAFQNQQDDERRALGNQRQERLISYNQALQDANKNYLRTLEQQQLAKQRELEVARDGHTKELNALSTKITNELALRRNGYQAELTLLSQTEAQKLKIQQDYQARAIASLAVQAAPGIINSVLGLISHHEGGGSMPAGGVSWINERPGQRESFNGTRFPAGKGLFISAQAGNVSPDSGGGNSIVVNVNGAQDPEMVGRVVVSHIKRVMGKPA